jgi:hypothetical protein
VIAPGSPGGPHALYSYPSRIQLIAAINNPSLAADARRPALSAAKSLRRALGPISGPMLDHILATRLNMPAVSAADIGLPRA